MCIYINKFNGFNASSLFSKNLCKYMTFFLNFYGKMMHRYITLWSSLSTQNLLTWMHCRIILIILASMLASIHSSIEYNYPFSIQHSCSIAMSLADQKTSVRMVLISGSLKIIAYLIITKYYLFVCIFKFFESIICCDSILLLWNVWYIIMAKKCTYVAWIS